MRAKSVIAEVQKVKSSKGAAIQTELGRLVDRGEVVKPERAFYRIASEAEKKDFLASKKERKIQAFYAEAAGATAGASDITFRRDDALQQIPALVAAIQQNVDHDKRETVGLFLYALIDEVIKVFPNRPENVQAGDRAKRSLLSAELPVRDVSDER